MDNIDISFVIPAYNCADYIEEAVFSIINLGLDNYEIVVVLSIFFADVELSFDGLFCLAVA